MPAFTQGFFHRFRHLQLPATKLILRMRPAEHSSRREELVQRRQVGRLRRCGFRIRGEWHRQDSSYHRPLTRAISHHNLSLQVVTWITSGKLAWSEHGTQGPGNSPVKEGTLYGYNTY